MLHITALQKVTNISELTPEDLSFLKQCILEFTFFSTKLMFSFQFSVLSNTTPKYLCFYPLHCFSFSVDWFGTSLILPKVNTHLFTFRNIQIQMILLHPFTKISVCSIVHPHHYWFFQPVLYHPQISLKDTAHQCFYSQLYTVRTEKELKLCLEVHQCLYK